MSTQPIARIDVQADNRIIDIIVDLPETFVSLVCIAEESVTLTVYCDFDDADDIIRAYTAATRICAMLNGEVER
mgnify:CR=1 FL=1